MVRLCGKTIGRAEYATYGFLWPLRKLPFGHRHTPVTLRHDTMSRHQQFAAISANDSPDSCRSVWGLVVAALFVLSGGIAEAAPPAGTVRVEEDWEVVINTPDPDGHAPQIITAMASRSELTDVHAVFELNHSTLPEYNAGGMQLQIWSGDTNLNHRHAYRFGLLSHNNEVIRYTMRMELKNGAIEFEVKDGTSSTWGDFGRYGWFRTSVATTQTNFVEYSPETSIKNSRVGFARHRVQRFFLKQVRYYSAAGLLATDETERVVHDLDAVEE